MANVLKVTMQQTIIELLSRGWSQRRVARELDLDRSTVARYARRHSESNGSKPTISTPGSDETLPPKAAISTPGTAGRRSLCEGFEPTIREKVFHGLSARRIHQDLVEERAFKGGYQSVKRFVRSLREATPAPYRRMECEPGQEVQVDFGRGAAVVDGKGKRRYPHLFRVVLSHSRKGYSEVVWRQSTEDFLRALENAFRHFGGVPATVVTDNLKAAVLKADWYDPELNPKLRSFAEHYGTTILPTRPRTPRHKGKVERGVGYVQDNALKGRKFTSLAEQNRFLQEWERRVADTRIHGTTRCQVRAAFELERPSLRGLPNSLFPCFQEAPRKVSIDGHVEVAKAYYSVPDEYRRRTVWARWDGRIVRVYNQRFEQIAVHARQEPGRFSTDRGHIPPEKISAVERGSHWMVGQAELVGPHCAAWARAVLKNRGVQGLRVLQGLLGLVGRHSAGAIEDACRTAVEHHAFRLAELRRLLKLAANEEPPGFLDRHPLIRDLSAYGELAAFPEPTKKESRP